jgi:NADH-quinone oxidoreductase subunit J
MNAAPQLFSTLPLLAAARWEAQAALWLVAFCVLLGALAAVKRPLATLVVCLVILAAILAVGGQVSEPLVLGAMIGSLALLLIVPPSTRERRIMGGVYAIAAAGALIYALVGGDARVVNEALAEWLVLGLLAAVTIGSGLAMIASRSAVYSAIWFALALLGTGGLFLYQGAMFLGVATVTVYAGAIVVTFLFVLMLAQPEGHTPYDRISWGWFAKPAAALAGGLMLASVAYSIASLGDASPPASADPERLRQMAHFGGYLFSRHLIAIEVGGTLLLAALVGAVAMLSQRKSSGDAHV